MKHVVFNTSWLDERRSEIDAMTHDERRRVVRCRLPVARSDALFSSRRQPARIAPAGWALMLCLAGAAALALLMLPIGGARDRAVGCRPQRKFQCPADRVAGSRSSGSARLGASDSLVGGVDGRPGLFGALGGLALYPFALGVGSIDPYEWGWRFSPLFVVIASADCRG